MPLVRPGPLAREATLVELDGRAAVFAPATDNVLFLNETATQVLHRCDGERSVDEIVTELAALYDVPVDAIQSSVESSLDTFTAAGLFPE
jgi:Coenzyme PQQ synthesis protein D (PqqD)